MVLNKRRPEVGDLRVYLLRSRRTGRASPDDGDTLDIHSGIWNLGDYIFECSLQKVFAKLVYLDLSMCVIVFIGMYLDL